MSFKYRHLTDVIQIQGRSVLRAICQGSGVTASLSPADGAEMCSLVIENDTGRHELLYRGNDWTPFRDWPGRAPWLWPVAGRTYSSVGETGKPVLQSAYCWEYDGRVLPMGMHGFARFKTWAASSTHCDTASAVVSARLESGPEDLDSFPFEYQLETGLSVSGSVLTLSMDVTAGLNNNGPMPFTIGYHPTFDLSSWWGADWLQGSLQGAGELGWQVDGLKLAGDPVRFMTQSVPLTHPQLADALIPAVQDQPVKMVSPGGQKALAFSFNASSLPSPEAALWVVHRDPQGRFFCLEPWVGWPNGLSTGRGRVQLSPGETWRMSLRIDVITAGRRDEAGTTPGRVVHINPGVVDSMLRPRAAATTGDERITEDP